MLRMGYSDHFLSVIRLLTLSNDNFSKVIEVICP